MSRYGMKIADETVYGIQHPDEALRLIKKIIDQFYGDKWIQHNPKCPLCNENLQDVEKNINKPVGECVNSKCDSTIHISDYMGKILDILAEADVEREQRLEKAKSKQTKYNLDDDDDDVISLPKPHKSNVVELGPRNAENTNDNLAAIPDENLMFVW